MSLKREIVLTENLCNKTFRVGELVKIKVLDAFVDAICIGKIKEINEDSVVIDTSKPYESSQKTVKYKNVRSIEMVE